ncbi:hypothetical protein GCM10018779_57890 [Streptomyces griseocarneus]|nr:hypothetical protein GCM10018779_57890 [Streptomyces griseocarneus]
MLAGATPVLVHNYNTGSARLHQYGRGNDVHFSIEFSDGSSASHTHLVPNKAETDTIIKVRGGSKQPTETHVFNLPDAVVRCRTKRDWDRPVARTSCK